MTPSDSSDLDAQFDLVLEHYGNWSSDIAYCARGCKSHGEHRKHYAAEAKQAFTKLITDEKRKAEINGRRIQAEATLDKWDNTDLASEYRFREFLNAQVEAHRYEAARLQKDGDAA